MQQRGASVFGAVRRRTDANSIADESLSEKTGDPVRDS